MHRMMSAERALAFDVRRKGAGHAYPRHASEDVRLYREGAHPTIGMAPAIAALEGKPTKRTWLPWGQGVSGSWDLGYSYGLVTSEEGSTARRDTSSYLHLWRRDVAGRWKLALDIENDFPRR
jgi:hypothetical protein